MAKCSENLNISVECKKNAADRITTVATVIIAVAAFCVAIWQGCEARRHNRLSVQPKLAFSYEFTPTEENQYFGLYICNKGIGPAIIKSFKIYVDNKLMEDKVYGGWDEALSLLGINKDWIKVKKLGTTGALSQGEKCVLIGVATENQTPERNEALHQALGRIDIRIKYESFYGDSAEDVSSKMYLGPTMTLQPKPPQELRK